MVFSTRLTMDGGIRHVVWLHTGSGIQFKFPRLAKTTEPTFFNRVCLGAMIKWNDKSKVRVKWLG